MYRFDSHKHIIYDAIGDFSERNWRGTERQYSCVFSGANPLSWCNDRDRKQKRLWKKEAKWTAPAAVGKEAETWQGLVDCSHAAGHTYCLFMAVLYLTRKDTTPVAWAKQSWRHTACVDACCWMLSMTKGNKLNYIQQYFNCWREGNNGSNYCSGACLLQAITKHASSQWVLSI